MKGSFDRGGPRLVLEEQEKRIILGNGGIGERENERIAEMMGMFPNRESHGEGRRREQEMKKKHLKLGKTAGKLGKDPPQIRYLNAGKSREWGVKMNFPTYDWNGGEVHVENDGKSMQGSSFSGIVIRFE
jgi:hypothetical protein